MLETTRGEVAADVVVVCAGLHADASPVSSGTGRRCASCPFSGEYLLWPPRCPNLVHGLVYPVPDPRFPFLGVHLTRGSTATCTPDPTPCSRSLARATAGATCAPPTCRHAVVAGFWRLARRHHAQRRRRGGALPVGPAFADSVRRLVPEMREADLVPAPAGCARRPCAPTARSSTTSSSSGTDAAVHLLNAPSPAATASLEIARHVVDHLPR